MWQAKQRGSFEQRQASAVARIEAEAAAEQTRCAGFPQVDHVTASWSEYEDGSVFDPLFHRTGPLPRRAKPGAQGGFTIIELLIVIAIIGMIAAIGIPAVTGKGSSLSWGVNGMTEERCIAGYVHVVGERGQARQVLSARGTGIPCGENATK